MRRWTFRLAMALGAAALLVLPSAGTAAATADQAPGSRDLVFLRAGESGRLDVWRMDADGTDALRVLRSGPALQIFGVSWLGGGRKILLSAKRGDEKPLHVYTMNPDGRNLRRITFGPNSQTGATSDPSGTRIAYFGLLQGEPTLWAVDVAGGNRRPLSQDPSLLGAAAWSPDGTRIAYSAESDMTVLKVGTARVERRLPPNGIVADWSPDGTQILSFSSWDGSIDLTDVNDGERHRIASGMGRLYGAAFAPDGRRVVFSFQAKSGGPFQLASVSRTGGRVRVLTSSPSDYLLPDWR